MNRAGPAAVAALLLAACAPAQGESGSSAYNLPQGLQEISGLAVAGPDSVFAHDDNTAIIYEIGLSDGHIKRAFALGKPTVEGDFEGIATAAGRVYLITSDGLIYGAKPVANGERAPFRVYDTGIGSLCEIEGLAEAPEPGHLLVLCKRPRQRDEDVKLTIYSWPLDSEHAPVSLWFSLPMKGIIKKSERHDFRPSGLEWDPRAQKLYVVSGHSRTLLVFDRDRHLVEKRRLNAESHPHTEGIAIMPDGRLVLSDEGSKTRSGRLAVYAKF